ncbi:hypothetical protein AURDEDRAFT_137862 [Auricularia subglabra TFB-10046 SS5]|nr:hypothetical protein AURDEDRAFT_137862 [Auricularia subglabra TFB-10046 SS5]
MSSNNVTLPPGIINPTTPLAFLPPTLADQYEASRYLYIATLGVWLWDAMSSAPEEYQLYFKSKWNLATGAYLVSRVGTFAFVLTSTLFQVAAVNDCQALQVGLGWCYFIAVPSTSFLFFLRLRAIFMDSRIVVGFFAFLWFSTLAGSMTVPFAVRGGHIGTTNRCINVEVQSFSSAAPVTNTVHSTLVFIAVSIRLLYTSSSRLTDQSRLRSFVMGETSSGSRISRALLQGGQLYYVATVGLNIVTVVMVLAPTVPAVFHAMFTVPNVALENSMACRVFRKLKGQSS